jgi:anti-sigma B factor antagonist
MSRASDVGWSDLTIELLRIRDRAVLAACGEIDIAPVDVLRDGAQEALAAGARELWVDLSAVEFLDSSGLRMLLDTRQQMLADGRHLRVICPEGPARRVIEVSGVEAALEIYPDRASAHAAG